MTRVTLTAGAIAAALCGCAVPQPQNTPVAPRLMREPATGRVYYLYVSTKYRPERPAPLIVTCHGTDPFDVAAHQVGEWKMLAEQHGCILICPKLRGTDGIFGAGPPAALLEDEALIMGAIAQVHYLYNVDRRNVLMTGFSGGGFAVYFIGLRHPGLFTALAARNANFNRNSTHGWYPPEALSLPVMVYYGANDPAAIQAQSKEAIQYLRSSGFTVATAVIPGSGHERHPEVAMKFWLEHWNHGGPAASAVRHAP